MIPKIRVPFLVAVLLLLVACLPVSCAHRADLTRSSSQDDFGVDMARQNLWREAMFRFRRAVEINPADAKAHNNLAVAYEANGDFEMARKEYLEALRLDRTNEYIQKNYSRFVEFLSRNKKRQSKDIKTAGESKSPASTTNTQPAPAPPPAAASDPQPPATTTQPQPAPIPPPKPPGANR